MNHIQLDFVDTLEVDWEIPGEIKNISKAFLLSNWKNGIVTGGCKRLQEYGVSFELHF